MGFWETFFFWFFSIGALFCSTLVILVRNPLYSAISLIVNFFFFAGLYVLLSAHFMAVIQVLVYGGAIMVLFVFIIMLLNLTEDELGEFEFRAHHVIAAAASFGLFLFFVYALAPLGDHEAVERNRAEAEATYQALEAAAEAAAGEGEEEAVVVEWPAVATMSRVDGLYVDLNEEALERGYRQKIAGWIAQEATPATGKYPPYVEGRPFRVPPVLEAVAVAPDPEGSSVLVDPRARATFGTAEPLSLLIVNRFVVPFELTALLLLAAIIGAVIIAKRRV